MDSRKLCKDHVPWEQPRSYDELDAFKLKNVDGYHLKNLQNERLIAHPEMSCAIFEPDKADGVEQAIFYLHKYATTRYYNGVAVAISCKIGKRNYVLKAEGDSVNVKEEQLPRCILGNTSEFIFYLRTFSDGHSETLHFESSLKRGYFLARDCERKVILKRPYSNTDETIGFLYYKVTTHI